MGRGNAQESSRAASATSSFIRPAAEHRAAQPWLASVCRQRAWIENQGCGQRARTQASQPAGVNEAGQGVCSQRGQSWKRDRRNFPVQIRPV